MPSHSHSYSNRVIPPYHHGVLVFLSFYRTAYAALILSKHFVKIVKALGDNLREATKLVTTEALRDMKLGSSNLQREPFSRLEARWPADPPNKPQQFAKPLFFTGGCHQGEEGENCKQVKVLITQGNAWRPRWGENNHQKGCLTMESKVYSDFFSLNTKKVSFFPLFLPSHY